MILRVSANHESFRSTEFGAGLNVVMAERTKESTKKDSRNGLGKSMLVEILHFCLGAATRHGGGLRIEPLNGWAFSLDMLLGGRRISVTRHVDHPGGILIEGDTSGWPMTPRWDKTLRAPALDVRDWNDVLGHFMFGLQPERAEAEYHPSFRSLISYGCGSISTRAVR